MNRPVRVILIGEAQTAYHDLNRVVGEQKAKGVANSKEIQLLKSIRDKTALIKANPFYGNNIPKNKIPRTYNVQNLWRVELTGYWRMLYTIKGDELEIICFVLDITAHDDYDKRFGYKKR